MSPRDAILEAVRRNLPRPAVPLPEIPGSELNDVDVGVIRSPLGVAEAGAVWLTQTELVVNALGVLSQHLVVLLDPAAAVETLHDAYGWLDVAASPYGVFLAGPSATGDIEGVIIHGAQGARSLTVLLMAPSGAEAPGTSGTEPGEKTGPRQ
ncbi:MAG: LUD domain-containing protein [Isosphaeraceae bacterium]